VSAVRAAKAKPAVSAYSCVKRTARVTRVRVDSAPVHGTTDTLTETEAPDMGPAREAIQDAYWQPTHGAARGWSAGLRMGRPGHIRVVGDDRRVSRICLVLAGERGGHVERDGAGDVADLDQPPPQQRQDEGGETVGDVNGPGHRSTSAADLGHRGEEGAFVVGDAAGVHQPAVGGDRDEVVVFLTDVDSDPHLRHRGRFLPSHRTWTWTWTWSMRRWVVRVARRLTTSDIDDRCCVREVRGRFTAGRSRVDGAGGDLHCQPNLRLSDTAMPAPHRSTNLRRCK
jgi:hypothetical protein